MGLPIALKIQSKNANMYSFFTYILIMLLYNPMIKKYVVTYQRSICFPIKSHSRMFDKVLNIPVKNTQGPFKEKFDYDQVFRTHFLGKK